MKRVTLFAIMLIGLFSCGKANGETPSGGKQNNTKWTDPIRVATYNIQYDNAKDASGAWKNRKEITKKLLQSCDFDIFGAQEPYADQVADIASWLPGYAWTGTNVMGDESATKRHYNPIFYKKDRFKVLDEGAFWYSESPNVAGSKSWDSYSPRMCNWVHFKDLKTGKEFFHFNSHFDHKGVEARKKSAEILIAKVREIAGDLPAFCTADYNADQKSEPYQIIVTSGLLVDSYSRAEVRENEKWPTYNGYSYKETPPANASRIDHIFITKKDNKVASWKIVNDTYNKQYPSDHSPVVIEWSFAE